MSASPGAQGGVFTAFPSKMSRNWKFAALAAAGVALMLFISAPTPHATRGSNGLRVSAVLAGCFVPFSASLLGGFRGGFSDFCGMCGFLMGRIMQWQQWFCGWMGVHACNSPPPFPAQRPLQLPNSGKSQRRLLCACVASLRRCFPPQHHCFHCVLSLYHHCRISAANATHSRSVPMTRLGSDALCLSPSVPSSSSSSSSSGHGTGCWRPRTDCGKV